MPLPIPQQASSLGKGSRVYQLALTVVVPTRHEAGTIDGFLQRLFRALDRIQAEIIIVDDSDGDDTYPILLRIREEVGGRRLVIVHRPEGSVPDRTLGTAVATGIDMARGEFVCVMDADGQHPPEAIPGMLALARETDADYVGGSRYSSGGSAEGLNGAGRKIISQALALATRLAFFFTPVRGLTDPLSGFFLFRRAIVDGAELKPIGWKISLEVLVRSRARNLTELPYVFSRRADGDSKADVRQGLLVLQHIVVLLLSLAGVRRFLSFGMVGMTGLGVNTGTLLLLQALGFNALTWPIWVSTELAILWNYTLNRRITWADRAYGRWWLYNIAAVCSSLVAIASTTALATAAATPLWLASVGGILIGMGLNYLMFDRVVFAACSWLAIRLDIPWQPAAVSAGGLTPRSVSSWSGGRAR
jgi:dolichol-phosphate mannosyltransferase